MISKQRNLIVDAVGDDAGGKHPSMNVRLDGKLLGTKNVRSGRRRGSFYVFGLPRGTRGKVEVRIEFVNDYCCQQGDRNLEIRSIRLT